MVASVICYTGETISFQFQVSSTTALQETSSFEVKDTNKGEKRPLILRRRRIRRKRRRSRRRRKSERR